MKTYKKSSWSGNGDCVHVAIDPLDGPSDGAVWVKDEWGNECQYDFEEWRIFLAGVRNNEFDLPDMPPPAVTFAELHREIASRDVQAEAYAAGLEGERATLLAELERSRGHQQVALRGWRDAAAKVEQHGE